MSVGQAAMSSPAKLGSDDGAAVRMSKIAPLLQRNRQFAASDSRARLAASLSPRTPLFVVTCIDPRVDPAAVLGVELGEAIILRNAGGRVTPAVIHDVAFLSYLGQMVERDGPLFEVAVVHHTLCETGLLANRGFRHAFAVRTGYGEEALAHQVVRDPAATVRADVKRLLAAPQVSPRISVSGHVYDLKTGLVSTVLAPMSPGSDLAESL
jgi:carbonic anhydrase